MTARSSLSRRLISLLPAVLILGLCCHFGATLLYLMPMNPIKARLAPPVNRYMEPYLAQRWELFAPDPIVDTRLLLVSCRVPDGHGGVLETPWYNITTPLRQLKYRHRFSPADRLDRVLGAPIHIIFQLPDPLLEKQVKAQYRDAADYKQALRSVDRQKKRQVEQGLRLLARLASAECDALNAPLPVSEVRVRMAVVKPPPFSQRYQPGEAGDTEYVEFDWAPYEQVRPL